MPAQLLFVFTLVTAIGAGVIAGVFFAFSTFVMKALSRLPANEGIAAMQSINVAVINPIFLGVFLGTAVSSLIAIVVAVLRWNQPSALWLLFGGVGYFIGTFLVTLLYNVPLNNSLARLKREDPQGPAEWSRYVARWTMWNHVRTVASFAAAVAFMFAL